MYESVVTTAELSGRLVMGIALMINGTTPARQALGGPIMIAKMAGKEAKQGFADVAGFTVMLSLELGIINLLPVPLLDGGHLLGLGVVRADHDLIREPGRLGRGRPLPEIPVALQHELAVRRRVVREVRRVERDLIRPSTRNRPGGEVDPGSGRDGICRG